MAWQSMLRILLAISTSLESGFCATDFATDLTDVFSTSSLEIGLLPTAAYPTTTRAADVPLVPSNTFYAEVIKNNGEGIC